MVPLTVAAPRQRPRSGLPAQISSFVGRERAIAELTALLEDVRLVTLIGAGGVGKTRLALEVAGRIAARFADGVELVELAPVSDATVVPAIVAEASGVAAMPGRPPLDALRAEVASKRLLILLDNCEHLRSACAELAQDLLRACPTLRILATSRESLGVAGERTWLVLPLSLQPAGGDASPRSGSAVSEAVQLFVDRARAADRAFVHDARSAGAIAEVCRRLDGIPLAIELAAAWTNVLSVPQIADRLASGAGFLRGPETASPRQRTLRATAEWSLRLLPEDERELFDLLSVFAGAFTLAAAQAVAGRDVLLSVGRLVAASLVSSAPRADDEARFRILEPLREVGRHRLGAARERSDGAHDAHAGYYMRLAGSVQDGLWGRTARGGGVPLLERNVDDLRAALRWLIARGDAERAGRLGAALARFWMYSGRVAEGRASLDELLALDGMTKRTRARLLVGAAGAATYDLDFRAARRLVDAALPAAGEVGDDWATAWAYYVLTLVSLGEAPDDAGSDRILEICGQAASRSRAAGDPILELMAVITGAMLQARTGRAVEADATARHALARASVIGAPREAARALTCLGLVSCRRGDLATARETLERARAAWEAEGEPLLGYGVLVRVFLVAVGLEMGDRRLARAHAAALLENWSEHGRAPQLAAIALRAFAHVSAVEGRSASVVRSCAALRAQGEPLDIAYPLGPSLATRLEAARSALGAVASAGAWGEGERLSLDQACDDARAELDATKPVQRSRRRLAGGLTEREAEVLRLVADGKTNREIAEVLVLSERTVGKHLDHIFTKIGVSTRAAATAFAFRSGLA